MNVAVFNGNQSFHTAFDFGRATLPGIVVPQQAARLDIELPATGTNSITKFGSSRSGLITFLPFPDPAQRLKWDEPLSDYKLGVKLKDALELSKTDLHWYVAHMDAADERVAAQFPVTLRVAIHWPGCVRHVSARIEYHGGRWHAARLAHEIAKHVHAFHRNFDRYKDEANPEPSWEPAAISFDKLYLVELRKANTRSSIVQAVLCCDLD